MSKGAKILVIDDEKSITKFLEANFLVHGYKVYLAHTGEEGLIEAQSKRPDIIILDLELPDIQGLEVLKRIREWSNIPVIILTVRYSDTDKVQLLDAGADDYLTKPFSVDELLARVRVALRHSVNLKDEPYYVNGPLEIDFNKRIVKLNNEIIKLTATEFDLLKVLVRGAGKIITHKQMLKEIWGPSAIEQSHYLRIHIGQLRKKLESEQIGQKIILTEPGVGYRLHIFC